MEYFDTAFIAKIYLQEAGSAEVRTEVAKQQAIACSAHGRVELAFVFHRKYREGTIDKRGLLARMKLVEEDTEAGLVQWLPLDDQVLGLAWQSVAQLQRRIPLRAADALHLVSARENGFKRVYSNDGHLLAGARHFGLQGCNLLQRNSG
jgi:predicted nucleic acid-binding protein